MSTTQPTKRRWRTAAGLLIGMYLIAFTAFQLLLHTPLRSWWVAQMLNLFAPWTYAPLPLALLLAGMVRSRRWGLALLVPLLVLAAEYGPLLLPERAAAAPALRVMTWNTLYNNTDAEAIAAVIDAEQPDLVVFQEFNLDASRKLEQLLRDTHPHQAFAPDEYGGGNGFGIASRHPILSAEPPQLGHETCRCQIARIEHEGRSFTIINTHPHVPSMNTDRGQKLPNTFTTAQQDPTFDALQALIASTDEPLIVAGDLNTTDRQPNYKALLPHLSDAFWEAGWGFGLTYPNQPKIGPLPPWPILRLDYILYDEHWRAQRSWVVDTPISDHRAVLAELTWE